MGFCTHYKPFFLYDKYGGRQPVHIGKLKVITSSSPYKAPYDIPSMASNLAISTFLFL